MNTAKANCSILIPRESWEEFQEWVLLSEDDSRFDFTRQWEPGTIERGGEPWLERIFPGILPGACVEKSVEGILR